MSKLGVSLKEPSTWVGIVSFLSLVGVQVTPEYSELITKVGVALGALLGLVFKWETPKSDATP